MVIALVSKPGLSSTTTLHIPKDWDATWFRNLISNQLKGADVRNAIGANGITVTGTIASPYATITLGPGPIVLNTATGTVTLTVNGAAGQYAEVVKGSSTSGQSFGLEVIAGTTASDINSVFLNAAGTVTLAEIFGDGHGVLGYNGTTNTIKFAASGAVTIGAASSVSGSDTLTVTGSNSANALTLVSGLARGNSMFQINGAATTGTRTPSFAATNKPGTGTTITNWLPIGLDGVMYWIPCFAN
jgi:hypothetical protein